MGMWGQDPELGHCLQLLTPQLSAGCGLSSL